MRLMHPEAIERPKSLSLPLSTSNSTSASRSSSTSSFSCSASQPSKLSHGLGAGNDDDNDEKECDIREEQACREVGAKEKAEADLVMNPCTRVDRNRNQFNPDEEHPLSEDNGTARAVPQGSGPRDFVLEELVSVTSAKVN